jgi:hypothetical protein
MSTGAVAGFKEVLMNLVALEERIARLEKELLRGAMHAEQRLLDQRAEIDRLHLELSAVRQFLGAVYPSFEEQFPQIMSRTIQEVNPEFD